MGRGCGIRMRQTQGTDPDYDALGHSQSLALGNIFENDDKFFTAVTEQGDAMPAQRRLHGPQGTSAGHLSPAGCSKDSL